jgi:hypothetical protein
MRKWLRTIWYRILADDQIEIKIGWRPLLIHVGILTCFSAFGGAWKVVAIVPVGVGTAFLKTNTARAFNAVLYLGLLVWGSASAAVDEHACPAWLALYWMWCALFTLHDEWLRCQRPHGKEAWRKE